jgi:hypothetical protein
MVDAAAALIRVNGFAKVIERPVIGLREGVA